MKKVKNGTTNPTKVYKHVNQDERALIGLLVADGESPTEIAKKLGRNKSTITREIERNHLDPHLKVGVCYRAKAHIAAEAAYKLSDQSDSKSSSSHT